MSMGKLRSTVNDTVGERSGRSARMSEKPRPGCAGASRKWHGSKHRVWEVIRTPRSAVGWEAPNSGSFRSVNRLEGGFLLALSGFFFTRWRLITLIIKAH